MHDAAIIHLSDIECGSENRADSDSIINGYQKVAGHLVDDVRGLVLEGWGIPRNRLGLVISGDIASKGSSVEYTKAQIILDTVRDQLGIDAACTAVVPGNHDVDWASCEAAFKKKMPDVSEPDATQREVVRSCREKLDNFGRFFEYACNLKWEGPESVVFFSGFIELGVVLVGLDTTYKCTFCEDDNVGFLRDDTVFKAGEIVA